MGGEGERKGKWGIGKRSGRDGKGKKGGEGREGEEKNGREGRLLNSLFWLVAIRHCSRQTVMTVWRLAVAEWLLRFVPYWSIGPILSTDVGTVVCGWDKWTDLTEAWTDHCQYLCPATSVYLIATFIIPTSHPQILFHRSFSRFSLVLHSWVFL